MRSERHEIVNVPPRRRQANETPLTKRLAIIERLASIAAHEIRNPLAAMRATAQLAFVTDDPRRRNTLITELIGTIDDLNEFLGELLGYAGPAGAFLVPVDLKLLMCDVVRLFETYATQQNVSIELDVDDEAIQVLGNGPLLRHCLINLMKNALTAMPRGGTLYMAALPDTTQKNVKVIVQDTGRGIPVRQRPHIFSGKSTSGGKGIGLPFVHRIVTELHRGHIRFHSEEKVGTTFYIQIPSAETASAQNRCLTESTDDTVPW